MLLISFYVIKIDVLDIRNYSSRCHGHVHGHVAKVVSDRISRRLPNNGENTKSRNVKTEREKGLAELTDHAKGKGESKAPECKTRVRTDSGKSKRRDRVISCPLFLKKNRCPVNWVNK